MAEPDSAQHRIASVEVVLVDTPAVSPAFVWRQGLPGSDGAGVEGWLVVTTDSGLRGFAHSRRGVILNDVVERRLRRELVGQDALAREYLWHRIWEIDRIESMPLHLLGVVDVALWDIGAKAAGVPLYMLLGSFRESIPAYASTVTFDDIPEFLDVADQCRDLGYPAIKLHAWGDPRKDAALAGALRERVGDDMDLMYDGSAGFDLADALYVGRALSHYGYLWYEEPMREHSVTAYKALADRVDIPLLVAETSGGAHMNTGDFIASGCAAAVRTSSALKGGVTGAMRIAHLADSFLLRAEVHGGGLVNTHLCMSISNTTYYESLVSSSVVERERAVGADGLVRAPTAAGVGWEAEWSAWGAPDGIDA
ncbi:mandelate racemase/muconate lactonizing enzyme family protein [Microbacterium awajiense]|uniref:Mandelate racemase/muconate lactonizing enzyme family protein n=1 Tax=Microbacterium awajiense TaxID=415214 RepID=A0ABP7AL25_9MICO